MPLEVGGGDIEALRAAALVMIDDIAGQVRAAFITIVPGQAETYRDKLDDCRAWLAASAPVLADHPWVAAEAAAQGVTPAAAAQTVVDTYVAWRVVGVAIEQARLTAKRAVRAATTPASVATARSDGVAALRAVLAAA